MASDDFENDINILILGETGVGKSTFLNALVNILFYRTLDDALNNELQVLIPSKFTMTDCETNKMVTIIAGQPDENEDYATGKSSTQQTRCYVFRFGNRRLRLIDTPGIGDVRGPDQDERNFEDILTYISQYEYLNGILILLHPTKTRVDIYFRFCIRELLRHLNVNAKDNIMFVFTHGRASFYRPGETSPLLKLLLDNIKSQNNIEIPFEKSNTFVLDNEGYRFLAAKKNNVIFSEEEKAAYTKSWENMATEGGRLIERVLMCDLHAVQDTLSLNEAFQLIRILSRPIAEVTRLIQKNRTMAENYKDNIVSSDQSVNLNSFPQLEGIFVKLDKRLTVCTENKCTRTVLVDGNPVIDYHTHCHVGCSLKRVVQECIGDPIIQRCRALARTGFCRNCGCHWEKHMHITYTFQGRPISINIQQIPGLTMRSSALKQINKRIEDLESEEKKIREIMIEISKFIRRNSLSPSNDHILEYLQLFLQEERQKQTVKANNTELMHSLEKLIEEYQVEITIFQKSFQKAEKDQNSFTVESQKIDRVFELVARLYSLPINGILIRKQVQAVKQNRRQSLARAERFIDLPTDYESGSIALSHFRKLINSRR